MNDYIDDYRSHHVAHKSGHGLAKAIAGTLILLLVAVLSFWSGTAYQKDHQPAPEQFTSAAADGPGLMTFGSGPNGQAVRMIGGTVSVVSADSISVKDPGGNTQTLTITSNTKVTNNGQAASLSDIKVGDSVMIRQDSANSQQAAEIILNPPSAGFSTNSAQ